MTTVSMLRKPRNCVEIVIELTCIEIWLTSFDKMRELITNYQHLWEAASEMSWFWKYFTVQGCSVILFSGTSRYFKNENSTYLFQMLNTLKRDWNTSWWLPLDVEIFTRVRPIFSLQWGKSVDMQAESIYWFQYDSKSDL